MSNFVNQKAAQAAGHIVGRDYNNYEAPKSGITKLFDDLKSQMERDDTVTDIIVDLARYHTQVANDGIVGLKMKLEVSGRSSFYMNAIEQKEMFAKLLEKHSLYSSAQQIFVLFLSKTESTFNHVVHPEIENGTISSINQMIIEHIIEPISQDCVSDSFVMSHNHIWGMIYWLAEQCFIRWHK